MNNRTWRRATRSGLWMLVLAICWQNTAVCWATSKTEPQLHGSATGAGLGKLMPNRWGMVQAAVSNPTDHDVTYRLVWWFDNQPNRQFVREVWVPARCQRRVAWPTRYEGPKPKNNGVDGRVRLMALNQDQELSAAQSMLMVLDETWLTSVVLGDGDAPAQGVSALREDQSLHTRMNYLGDMSELAPRNVIGWDPTDMVVLAREKMQLDPAQQQAIRQWLAGGGTVWVMLDQVGASQLSAWLGDDAPLTKVDRVTLTSAHLQPVGPAAEAAHVLKERRNKNEKLADKPVVVEQPMTLVRVLAEPRAGWRPLMMVGDWPALLERRVGTGRLIVSTIDSRAWTDPGAALARGAMSRVVYPPMTVDRPLVDDDAAKAFARSQIGYQIAGRPLIAVVLGAYLLLFIVVGWIARRRGRAEGAVSVGIILAAATTVVLLVIGYMQRGKVEATDAMLQLVTARPGSVTATVQGRMAMFAPFARDASLHSNRGGWAWPDDATAHSLRRMVWTDMDAWRWQELKIDGGTSQIMQVHGQARFDRPLSLTWSIDDNGLVATASGDHAAQWQDMVLATGRAVCAVSRESAAGGAVQLRVRPDSVLPAGNYVAAGVMTQTQRNRNDVLNNAANQLRLMEPTLLAWSDRVDDGMKDDPAIEQRGAALWQVPVRFAKVAAGQHVVVPWPLVRMDVTMHGGSQIAQVASMYNIREHQFISTPTSGPFTVRFTPPAQVQPLKLDHATLVLNMAAIGRPVKIRSVEGRRRTELTSLESPDGTYRLDLPIDQLKMHDGAVTLEIEVGDLLSKTQELDSQTAQWKIEQLGLELQGVVGR